MDSLTGKMVTEFIKEFECSLDPRLWVSLIREEKKELEEALLEEDRHNVLKEATDLMYVQIGFNLVSVGAEQLGLFPDTEHAEILSLLTESGKVYESALSYLGEVNLFEAFRRVHLSNMSKMGEDGLPVKDKDTGKTLKGPNYKAPNLKDLL